MIDFTLDKEKATLHAKPKGPLSKEDFIVLAETVDPFIEQSGGLKGLILETVRFPGWEDLGAAVRHFRFVRDHHRKIKKVAIVTDSMLGETAERIASHFVAAEIKQFAAGKIADAQAWINSAQTT